MLVRLKGEKIGHMSYSSRPEGDGKLSFSTSVMDGKMLGFTLQIKIETKTWTDAKGDPKRIEFVTESGGKTQTVVATFEAKSIQATSTMDGRTTKATIPIPEGAAITDDPLTPFVEGKAPGPIYVFDPNTLALVRCEPQVKGKEKLQTSAGEVEATVIDLRDPRAPMTVYLSGKGDILKATGPFGMEIVPCTKEEALAASGDADIATASSITPDRPIKDSYRIKNLKLKFSGVDPARLPSDDHQTVEKVEGGFILTIHPVQPDGLQPSETPTDPRWSQADLRVPSDKKRFIELAKSITQGKAAMLDRAEAIRNFVLGKIRANAGIGVLRDADDVLDTGEGVCRDHAVLMATLLRADGIPTRLVSGLVYGMGAFYYHAWVEIWTGQKWLGLDSTRPSKGLDATHIKIAQGTVGEAFTSFLLDGAKVTVVKD
ncbi:MAG: transglutaminase family protein [Armatimonadetes bacterium]|nr:transglutaminase family protein [Armatimonadota bacterium]